MESDVLLPTEATREWLFNLWRAAGSAEQEAQLTADHLVGANLAGHDSHGVSMAGPYVRSLRASELQLNQKLSIVTDTETLLVVDGNRGIGQSMAFQTMQLAIERARKNGVVIVGLRNSHHIGRVGHWAEQAIAAGLEERFAGAHPLAGTHDSGFAGAAPDLLRNCVVYVCATGERGRAAACRVADFWAAVFAATPVFIDPAEHDRLLAWTSHLPQAVAYVLANALSARRTPLQSLGPGARDTTRLAASSPEMWLDILLMNRPALDEALEQTGVALAELRALLASGDTAGLERYLTAAREFRRGLDR